MIVTQMPIYSQQEWQKRNFKDINLKPILGSGPYVIERIDAGRSISYKRNRIIGVKTCWSIAAVIILIAYSIAITVVRKSSLRLLNRDSLRYMRKNRLIAG